MKNEETLTSEQRLTIIEQMIATAQGKIMDNSFHFLLWGWVVAIANLAHYYLDTFTNYPHPYIVWLITFPAGIVAAIYGRRQGREMTVRTYTDRITLNVWIAYGLSIFTVIFFGMKFSFMINPLIMLITGFATYLSGVIIKFKPLKWGGFGFWVASIACFLAPLQAQPIIAAIAIVLGYLVPGYLLKSKRNNG